MLTVTWSQLNKPSVAGALMTLANSNKVDRTTAYRAARIVEKANREMEKAREYEEKLVAQYAKKDDKGQIIKNENGQAEMDEESQKKLNAEFEKYCAEQKVEIKVHKLDFTKLDGLTGTQLLALSDFVEGVPEVA